MKYIISISVIVLHLLQPHCMAQTINTLPLPAKDITYCDLKCNCGDKTTPIGINTDHVHNMGEWMVAYTFMNMAMKGTKMGSQTASDDQVYKTYMMSPAEMTMQMQMVMVMYGISNKLSLMAMGGYLNNYMNMTMARNMPSMPGMSISNMPTNMPNTSMWLTDTKLTALYSLLDKGRKQITGSIGISLPTGSITETGTTILGNDQHLAYCMQTGTGSYNLLPGIDYTTKINRIDIGIEGNGDIKLNKNSIGYKYGNVYRANIWAACRLATFISASLRAEGIATDKITGTDPQVAIPTNISYDPTTDTKNTGGQLLNLYAGINLHFAKRVLTNFHFLVEYGMPLYQNLNGIQSAQKNNLLLGAQYRL